MQARDEPARSRLNKSSWGALNAEGGRGEDVERQEQAGAKGSKRIEEEATVLHPRA